MSASPDRGPLRLMRRLLDGPHRWGRVAVTFSRYGITRYTLVLYPPGTDRTGRIRLRLAEAWPTVGLLIGIVLLVADPLRAGAASPVLAAAAWVLGWLGTRHLARRERRHVLVLHGIAGIGPSEAARLQAMGEIVRTLEDADVGLAEGRLSPVEHELAWNAAYGEAALAAGRAREPRVPHPPF